MPPADTWIEGFVQFVDQRRRKEPPPQDASSAAEAAAVRAIIAASLATTLAETEAVRAARLAVGGGVPDPAVVITTTATGIMAAAELIASSADLAAVVAGRLIAVTELEYRLWCIRSPDDAFIHHVNVWNWIKTSVPPQRRAEFAGYPIGDGEAYWLHREGRAGAAALDRRACHLWRWNGKHAALLKAFVTERSVGPLGPRHDDA